MNENNIVEDEINTLGRLGGTDMDMEPEGCIIGQQKWEKVKKKAG